MILGGQWYVPYASRSDEFTLYHTGDWHTCARVCAMDKLRADLRRVEQNEHGLLAITGDQADCIGYTDRRFDPHDVDLDLLDMRDLNRLAERQFEIVEELIEPVAGKVIGMNMGNHEEKILKQTQNMGLWTRLCERLGVPNLDYDGLVDLIFCRKPGYDGPPLVREKPRGAANAWQVKVLMHHGRGYSRSPGGKLNTLIAFGDNFPQADVVLVGHLHTRMRFDRPVIGTDARCESITDHLQVLSMCGAYLRTYAEGPATYSERKAYAPVVLGMQQIHFLPDKRTIE